jgi:hypothetical protein
MPAHPKLFVLEKFSFIRVIVMRSFSSLNRENSVVHEYLKSM